MPTKKELELALEKKTTQILKMENEVEQLNKEWDKYEKFIGTIGYTLQEIYKCYPHVIGECCTEKELLKIFRVQSEISEFIRKVQQLKHKEDEESGFDEI